MIKTFEPRELSTKMLNAISQHKDILERINGFYNKFLIPFDRSLLFHLSRTMVKHSSPTEIIEWNIGARENGIMNDNDNAISTVETFKIVNDFINAESQKAMDRILTYCEHEFDGKVFKNSPCYDIKIVCPDGQLESYQSLLFYEENHECVIYYYLDFIYLFPLTIQEFEKFLFYFLTFLIEEEYPVNVKINESLNFIKNINEIVRMRYIDIDNRIILAFLHLICIDNELSECANLIYEDIKHNNDQLRMQFESLSSL